MVRSFPVRFAMNCSDAAVVLVFQLLFPDLNFRSTILDPRPYRPNQAAA
jgi:hypothetical protein